LPTLKDPSRNVGTADFAGNAVLVNVWATWCVGCRQEHEFLLQLSRSGVIPIYGINWRDTRSDALRWLERLGDPYVASADDGDGRVGIDWGVYGAPETFLVGPDGTVLHKHLGPLSWAAWQQDFVPLLEQSESF
jgi:cytochrome c biogenesis protein CcmG/thiol:disulfide interchange protein DsbE